MNQQKPFQFSIAWMFILMTVLAHVVAIVVYFGVAGAQFLGGAVLLLVLIFIGYLVGSTAIGTKKEVPFWQATLASLLTIFASQPYRYIHITEKLAVSQAIVLGLGLMLSAVAIYRGNFATKLFALPALLWFGFVAKYYVRFSIVMCDWNEIWRFWFTEASG